MQLLGIIAFTSALTDERWEELLANHEEMVATDSIEIQNPFTQEVESISSAKKLAHVTSDGGIVGGLRWCIDDSGIEVFGDSDKMNPFAEQIAQELDSSYGPCH